MYTDNIVAYPGLSRADYPEKFFNRDMSNIDREKVNRAEAQSVTSGEKHRFTAVRKLRSQRGESFAEVLAAGVVAALGLIMLASMVMSSVKIVKKTTASYRQMMAAQNAVEARAAFTDPEDSSVSAGFADAGTVKVEMKPTTAPMQLGASVPGIDLQPLIMYQLTEGGDNSIRASYSGWTDREYGVYQVTK